MQEQGSMITPSFSRTATKEEIALFIAQFGGRIPAWYHHLIAEVPLIHIEVGWQAYERKDGYDGIAYVEIYQQEIWSMNPSRHFPAYRFWNTDIFVSVRIQ